MLTLPVGKVLLKGSIWTTVGEVLSGVGMLAAGVVAGAALSPHDFGSMGTAMLALMIVDQFSQTGFHSALVQRENDVESYLDVAFTWHLIRGAFLCVLLALAPWLGRLYAEPMLVPVHARGGDPPAARRCANIGQVHFHRKLDFRALALVKLGQTALRIAIFVPGNSHFKNVWALVIGVLASALSGVIVSYVSHPYRPRLRWDTQRLRELIRYGKWLTGFRRHRFLHRLRRRQPVRQQVPRCRGARCLPARIRCSELPRHQHHARARPHRFPDPTRDCSATTRSPARGLSSGDACRAALERARLGVALSLPGPTIFIRQVFGEKWAPAIPLVRIRHFRAWSAPSRLSVVPSSTQPGGPTSTSR